MQTETSAWLYDILNAIVEITTFLDGVTDFFTYQQDLKTKRAIERNLEIIGEAMNRISKKDPSIVLSHSKRIIETRNRIIHVYDTVSDEIIWSIITKHLPFLQKEIELIMQS